MYTLIQVDGEDLSGSREPNVVVDIGFGDREYYAFTNEYSQLVKVIDKEIILQNDSIEPVTSSGRYYLDEAKVLGIGSSSLDEGHVIADSLGGVSNAYNINPYEYNASLGLNESTGTNTNINETSSPSLVYWTPNGKSYHITKSCSTLSRSKTILEGTLQESNKSDP